MIPKRNVSPGGSSLRAVAPPFSPLSSLPAVRTELKEATSESRTDRTRLNFDESLAACQDATQAPQGPCKTDSDIPDKAACSIPTEEVDTDELHQDQDQDHLSDIDISGDIDSDHPFCDQYYPPDSWCMPGALNTYLSEEELEMQKELEEIYDAMDEEHSESYQDYNDYNDDESWREEVSDAIENDPLVTPMSQQVIKHYLILMF
jgi:hypothetical protein